MTTRERWIVYPLLFLTLGLALRDKVIPPMQTRSFAVTSREVYTNTLRCGEIKADRAEFRSMAADKVTWKEADIEAATVRIGVRLSEEAPSNGCPGETDSQE
jgi:hypothetical protein